MKSVRPSTRPRTRRPVTAIAIVLALAAIGTGVLVRSGAGAAGVVSGTVYRDANANGVRDRGEVGVGNVVVSSGSVSTVTSANGRWTLNLDGTAASTVRVVTGWYRTQCNAVSCPAGPGADQDFAVQNQMIVAEVAAGADAVLDAGVVPDWSGGYPMPRVRWLRANRVDVSARVSFVAPTGGPGTNCFRTDDPANRACAIGDQPQFLAQVYNEGTTSITNPSGYLELPPGTALVSMVPSIEPGNNPAVPAVTVGAFDPASRRVPFALQGALPPAGAALFTVTLAIAPDAPLTTTFQTKGSYPNPIGIRITSVARDAEGDRCRADATSCPWGQTNTQIWPDNSDTVGFAIVTAPEQPSAPVQTTAPVTAAPTTTAPATTVPATTAPRPTAPATTAPTTTVPATTVPVTTAPPPPSDGSCTVSSLLVPSCGAWLGATTAARSGAKNTADYAIGLDEYEAVSGNVPDILHFYRSGAAKFPSQAEINMANRPGKQRSILFYNWKPTSGAWSDVPKGSADSAIATVATSLKAYPHKLFLTVWHEPENDITSSGRTEADYVAMYRYVVTKLRSLGVTNVVFVMNYMGFSGWSSMVDQLYPGDDVVDWIAYDPYGFKSHDDFGEFLDTANKSWPGFYSWATAKAPGKPIMLAEWGFDLNDAPLAPQILDGAVPIIQSRFPMLKALVYWHDDNGGFSVRLDQSSSLGQAYGQAYRRLAADPFFNLTPTAAAP